MDANEYQKLAMTTLNPEIEKDKIIIIRLFAFRGKYHLFTDVRVRLSPKPESELWDLCSVIESYRIHSIIISQASNEKKYGK